MSHNNGVIIYVSVEIQSENRGAFEVNLNQVMNSARQHRGCLKYQWFINPDNNCNYVIYGEFDTNDSFVLYRKSDIIPMIGKQLLPLIKGKPSFKHFHTEIFEEGI